MLFQHCYEIVPWITINCQPMINYKPIWYLDLIEGNINLHKESLHGNEKLCSSVCVKTPMLHKYSVIICTQHFYTICLCEM